MIPLALFTQAGIQIGRAELLDDTMVKVLNKANHTKHTEATTLLFELSVRNLYRWW